MWTSGYVMALSAGLCAASASVAAKFAFSSQEAERLYTLLLTHLPISASDYSLITPSLRVVCFLLVLGLNGLMWTMYVKAMQVIGTVQATLTNTSANLLSTAVFGWLVFNETQSIRWFCGATLIITGLLLMQRGSKDLLPENTTHEKKKR